MHKNTINTSVCQQRTSTVPDIFGVCIFATKQRKIAKPKTTVNPQLKRALEYIANTGRSPAIIQFDEDHEPIGPLIREQLKDARLVYEREGRIHECP